MMEEEAAGYDFEFVDELLPCQACSICFLAMRNPVQTMCGHRFCETCLLKAIRCCMLHILAFGSPKNLSTVKCSVLTMVIKTKMQYVQT